MPERITIAETTLQALKGTFPEVPTYPHVDTDLLYQGDSSPFHITLPIAEIGQVSSNGLVYDRPLVESIAEQMQLGVGGLRGHIPTAELDTAYPLDAVHWIGHQLDGTTLWAKGYVPPGPTREDIRLKKARNGNIATSIFGNAIKEFAVAASGKAGRTYKARQFTLESIDLAPSTRAAFKNRKGFHITREMEGNNMPVQDILTVADVPENIREMIIAESELANKVGRVAELEKSNGDLTTQVAELATFKQIVAEIRTTLGKDADTVEVVTQYHSMATKLAEMLGVPYTNIEIRVQEMHEQVAELKKQAFEGAVDSRVAELTKWTVSAPEAQKRVDAFRNTLRRAIVAELAGAQDTEKIVETSQKVWDEQFSLIAETVVASLAGPSAIIGARLNPAADDNKAARGTDEEIDALAGRYNKK